MFRDFGLENKSKAQYVYLKFAFLIMSLSKYIHYSAWRVGGDDDDEYSYSAETEISCFVCTLMTTHSPFPQPSQPPDMDSFDTTQ